MKVLVTGGGGFLGGAVARALHARGDEVHCLQRGEYPALTALGVGVHTGDMTDREAVIAATRGCEAVIHVAGLTGVWGPYEDYFHANVTGTRVILDACRANRVRKLVYTSSPSVVFDGRDEEHLDETAPYPEKYFNHYQRTKASAEQMVLAANDDALSTVALRPHLIWGPGDPHLVGRILARAGTGRLRLARSRKLVDSTYLDNAVDAHLAAADRIGVGAACAGKVYFISNGEPLPMHALVNRILDAAGMPAIDKTLPDGLLYQAGLWSECLYWLINIKKEPLMTRFIARQLSCAHWYDISAARRDLGYTPRVSIEEGMARLEASLAGAREN